MPTLQSGATVAGYRIERKLGAGGAGQVYLARHPRLPRWDALKILWRGTDPEFRARFLREAELAGRLDHPNIVAVYDCGGDGDLLWIAMQFVDGQDAAELLRQHPDGLPPERAVAIVEGAARGLDAAHRAGLLHRDVKPANILIGPDGSGADRVLVADFGIARETAETVAMTAAGTVVATLAYAAPEQIGGGALDRRTDVYALGATLYQLLTGAPPFPREHAAAVLHAQLTAPRPRPSRVRRTLPRGFDTVIARAMAVDPAERYSSCGELAAAASAALQGQPVGPAPRSGRRRMLRSAVALALGAALTAAVLLIVRPDRAPVAASDHAGPSGSVSTTAPGSGWGAYDFIVTAFPALLPATPSARGYQGLRCSAANAADQAVALDAPADHPRLACTSGGDVTVKLACNADRSAQPALQPSAKAEGDEAWSRPGGTGRITWETITADGSPRGRMDVQFDGPARNFCQLTVLGATSGHDLHDQWWPTAPI